MPHPIVLAITGGSGAIYAVRLLEALTSAGRDIHLSISPSGQAVIQQELTLPVDLDNFDIGDLLTESGASRVALLRETTARPKQGRSEEVQHGKDQPSKAPSPPARGKVDYHHHRDMLSPIASGSFLTAGMVVCPCSGGTLSAVAHAANDNLIRRAAEVHLKERRRLILVPRETPLSLPHIENLRSAAQAGAVILPAAPGWYHNPTRLADLVDFLVSRICDQLGVENCLVTRWGGAK